MRKMRMRQPGLHELPGTARSSGKTSTTFVREKVLPKMRSSAGRTATTARRKSARRCCMRSSSSDW
ncbi:hypothetical protein OESDEN_24535 [Oesophagostomum dentatum]|uniref:Uncharacterized protein n=1 Tax=Oesophagostomum dentatum TaxID=61180 RepID=A0A0B1RS07_OESDE|nr:hypothetical protein OESDEN_24535 [Oesophagostomum dentatum]